MCQKCVDAVKKHWPGLTDQEMSERQLIEMAEKSGRDVGLAIAIACEETETAMRELDAENHSD